jgi:aspartate carbamoyltransferase catalytic subunit
MFSTKLLNVSHVNYLLTKAEQMKLGNFIFKKFILVNAFFKPSTRTALSFESATYRLGGNVITFNKDVSTSKENYKDIIRNLGCYGDILTILHPDKEAVKQASNISRIPLISAGDGEEEHSIQSLIDIFTIHEHLQWLHFHHPLVYLEQNHHPHSYEPYNILFVGDILHSHSIRSLLHLLLLYKPFNIYLLPYKGCEPEETMVSLLQKNNRDSDNPIVLTKENINWGKFEIVYCTRLQNCENDTEKKPDIILNKKILNEMSKTSIVLHPLPRNEELPTSIDSNRRCAFIDQIKNGVFVQMALLDAFLQDGDFEQKNVELNIHTFDLV